MTGLLRANVTIALDRHPTLGATGWHSARTMRLYGWTPEAATKDLTDLRTKTSIECICAVAEWLLGWPPVKAANRGSPDSYGLKHRAEIYLRDDRHVNGYVANGQLIAAAYAIGYPVRRFDPGSPNSEIGIRRRDFTEMCRQANAMRERWAAAS